VRRCRSFLAVAALAALVLGLAGAVLAQVTGTDDTASDGAQLEPTPSPRPGGRVSAGGDPVVRTGARLDATLAAGAAGDPALSGEAELVVTPRRGTLCFDIDLDSSADEAESVVAVHIHPGDAGDPPCDAEDCAPPIDLDFANQGLEGCARAGKHLLSTLVLEPEQFFLHVHTARFPEGALSGQLEEND
jgi:hypothetical protein